MPTILALAADTLLYQSGMNIICQICFWEDDGHDDADVDEESGANSKEDIDAPAYTLAEARENFRRYGTCFDPGHEKKLGMKKLFGDKREILLSTFDEIYSLARSFAISRKEIPIHIPEIRALFKKAEEILRDLE